MFELCYSIFCASLPCLALLALLSVTPLSTAAISNPVAEMDQAHYIHIITNVSTDSKTQQLKMTSTG